MTVIDGHHPLLQSLRAGSDDTEGHEARRVAEVLEAALTESRAVAEQDDASAAACLTAARIALCDARRYVTGGGGPGAPLAQYLDVEHRQLYARARARFGPGQDLIPPCHQAMS